ncbi:MAG TPA: FAD-dependent oxidoreductase [Planctomycetota bacterium]|nr:FAD-dependent oxidoreductase [Planctomycetota bacterium]
MAVHSEPARDIPIVEHAEVLVAGGGPAGVAAAIAAARRGASTRLLESNGCLGGTWTAGLLSWILDSGNKRGVIKEIIAELEKRGAVARYGGDVGYDVETMKLVLDELCLAAGVRVQLHTRVVAAHAPDRRLALAVTESKSGRQAWAADAFVDATGDGDLAARAGCGFDYGREGTGQAQPMSLICLVTGIAPDGVAEYVRGLAEPKGERNPKGRLKAEMERAGVSPSYAQPTLFYIRGGLFCMMANHEYGVAGTDAAQVTEATLRGRAEVHKLVNALRALGGIWKDLRIVATPEHIGVREGRRVRGLYQVTAADLAAGARHADAVCRVNFPVDVHSTDPGKDKGIARERVRAKPYDIPYRALVAKDVKGLLLAGRCISGDFIAHSSYRVTGNAVAMGEAAGAAAALAAKSSRLPHNLPWPEVQKALDL